jgi:hypothetical protein
VAADSFTILSQIHDVESIATGDCDWAWHPGSRALQETFGSGNWRKLKGFATVQLEDGTIADAEIHWYEAHGIGKRWMKIKRYLD